MVSFLSSPISCSIRCSAVLISATTCTKRAECNKVKFVGVRGQKKAHKRKKCQGQEIKKGRNDTSALT